MGCHFLLQGIFLTQGSNPHFLYLLHCRWILFTAEPPGEPLRRGVCPIGPSPEKVPQYSHTPPRDIPSGKMLAINGCPWSEWKLISPSKQRRKRTWVKKEGFPGGSAVKHLSANAGGACLIPDPGRSPGEGNGNPLQYSCLGNPMHRGAWQATLHGIAKSQIRLSTYAKKKEGSKAS